MKTVVDGLMVNYVDEGVGKVVLFLHGWGSSLKPFKGLMGDLKNSYRVVAVDFPGFGESEKPKEAWDVQKYVEFLTGFLKKIGVEDVHAMVGHSFGGRVILKGVGEGFLAAEKIVFLDAAGVKPQGSAKKNLIKFLAKAGKATTKIPGVKKMESGLKKSLYGMAGSSDYMNVSGVMKETFKKVIDEDLSGYIPKISSPTLIVWGEDDVDTPLADAYRFAEIEGSRLEVLVGAGHYSFLDKPEEVNKLVKEFLGEEVRFTV